MPTEIEEVLFENASITYLNFAGNEGPYNKEGDRNFVIRLDENQARDLAAKGWNVKRGKSKPDQEEEPFPFLPVGVGFKAFPPKITVLTESSRTMLNEGNVGLLDWADIKQVDVLIRPYHWEYGGDRGIKAYVKTMFVHINEDPLERKYADVHPGN